MLFYTTYIYCGLKFKTYNRKHVLENSEKNVNCCIIYEKQNWNKNIGNWMIKQNMIWIFEYYLDTKRNELLIDGIL